MGILAFVQDFCDVPKQGETVHIDKARLSFPAYGPIHTAADYYGLQSDSRKDLHCLIISLAFAKKDADFPGTAAIHRDVQVTYADILAIKTGLLHLQQQTHLTHCLIEGARL